MSVVESHQIKVRIRNCVVCVVLSYTVLQFVDSYKYCSWREHTEADLNFKYAVSGHVGSLPDTNYWLSYNFVKFILQII